MDGTHERINAPVQPIGRKLLFSCHHTLSIGL
jgi:hypothetical protein